MKNRYLHGKSTPRWIVLLIDLIIVSWSFTLSYFIVSEFQFSMMIRGYYFVYTGLLCAIALPVIVLMRLHTGLLRYSNTTDMIRIFKAVFIFTVLYVILAASVLMERFPLKHFTALLLINFFITSSIMIMMRVSAKSLFAAMIKRASEKKTVRALIYGSDKNAILVKKALENSDETNYVIAGFVDMKRAHLNSYMEQKRVYHIRELQRLKAQKKIDQLIIVNEDLGEGTKRVLLDHSLRHGIKVVTVPPVQSWLSGGLSKMQIKELRIEDLLQRKPIKMDQSAVRKDLKGKRVLVTGAAGSIGSEIVRQVLAYDPALLVLCDQAESPSYQMQLEICDNYPDAKCEVVIADVTNRERMESLFKTWKPQIVYHAAAYKHVPLMESNPFEAICTNIQGTKNVADLSVLYNVEKFVMISTDKAVNPTNIMGASKRIAEIYIQSLNDSQDKFREIRNSPETSLRTRFITTRFGNVLGSNGSVIPRFRSQIERGGPITVTHPEITRYFMTISEAVQLVLEASTMGTGGEIFVFDMGSPVKIYDMAKKMIQLAGLVYGKDINIVFTGLRPGEKLYEELLNSAESTLPTYHEKIKIAKVRSYGYCEVEKSIENLMAVNESSDAFAVVKQMKDLVPEYISNNSPYEELDVESTEPYDKGLKV